MQPHVLSYHQFYRSDLGRAARDLIAAQVARFWPVDATAHPDTSILGVGYALPYLEPYEKAGGSCFAMMPAAQGVCHWPDVGLNRTLLAHPAHWPFDESSFKRVMLVHALEHAGKADDLLAELWRVLEPGGEALVIVPNRRRMWAALDNTPFGQGRPYSRRQVSQMLEAQLLTLDKTASALMVPPMPGRAGAAILHALERPVRALAPGLGGLLVLRAVKRVYQPMKGRSRRVTMPVKVPGGAIAINSMQSSPDFAGQD